jgi:hypothetical protein
MALIYVAGYIVRNEVQMMTRDPWSTIYIIILMKNMIRLLMNLIGGELTVPGDGCRSCMS